MAQSEGMSTEEFQTQLSGLLNMPGMDAGAVLAECGYVPQSEAKPADLEKITAEAEARGRDAAEANMTGILDVCLLGNVPEMAAGLIKEGASVDEARKKVLDYKAAQDGNNEIRSTLTPNNTGETNPLLADARKRADQAGK